MSRLPSIIEMLQAGVHLGHKKSRRHPKMEPFIFTTKNEMSIIDLEKTVEYLEKAVAFAKKAASEGKMILFVSTKRQAQALVKQYADACGMPYVNVRWIGGTLTNFAVISKMIKKLKDMKAKMDSGDFAKYTKKEQLELSRTIKELEDTIGGIQNLTRLPDVVFIIDPKRDKTALQESIRKQIPIISLSDTNVNPNEITYPIPANDDAVKAITLLLGCMTDAINEGKANPYVKEMAKPAEVAVEEADIPVVVTEEEVIDELKTEDKLINKAVKEIIKDKEEKEVKEVKKAIHKEKEEARVKEHTPKTK